MWPYEFFPNSYFTEDYWPKAPAFVSGRNGSGIGKRDPRHLLWQTQEQERRRREKLEKLKHSYRAFLKKLIHRDDAARLSSMKSPLSNQDKLTNAASSFVMLLSEA